jgi:L-lactate dehydrogenase complex protein LldF
MTQLRETVREKLADVGLQEALAKALATSSEKREAALSELHNVDALKESAAELRRHSVGRMWQLLESFESKLQEAGTTVLWARDPSDVRRYVAEIASAHKVSRTVLSKSMVGEEIGLEQAIKDAGSSVIQSDVGERIVQLAKQKPSHIILPCIHLRAADVGKILHDHGRMPYSEDPTELSRGLGKSLRPHFLGAHMGVSGANFLVADSGTIVCVENEGNIRMGYSVPPVHVVVTAVEKVLPTRDDARLLLSLLPRLATGQRATAYTSFLGPAPLPGQSRYVILVDNGRSELFGAGPFRELLHCIRCGACLSNCPVYRRVGGHAYNWVYPGPIGIAMAALIAPDEAVESLSLCTLCGACSEVCPVRIPLDRLILLGRATVRGRLRASTVRKDRRALRWFKRAMSGRARYRLSDWGHRTGLAWFAGTVASLQKKLGWHGERNAPAPADRLFRTWWARRKKRGDLK